MDERTASATPSGSGGGGAPSMAIIAIRAISAVPPVSSCPTQ